MKLNCLTVNGKHLRSICSWLPAACPREKSDFQQLSIFRDDASLLIYKARHVLCTQATLYYYIYNQWLPIHLCSSAFVLFAIKSCINWRRLVYSWLFEKRFCRYAIVIRYNWFAYSSKYDKKYRERVTHQWKLLITRHFGFVRYYYPFCVQHYELYE